MTLTASSAPATGAAPAPSRRAPDLVTFGTLGLALAFFAVALRTTDQDQMNGYGLISVLGWPFFSSLILICYAAAREFSRKNLRTSHLTAVAVVLIIVLFGIQNGSDSAAGFAVAWLHVGFADFIVDTGRGVQFYDARFSWPGFFAASASLTTLAGIDDAVPLLRWAPVTYNLLALLPMVLLARHVTSRAHIAWLGILLYYCANWYEQDYYSPQATNLILYLCTIALLMWLGHSAAPGTDTGIIARLRGWWAAGIFRSLGALVSAVLHGRPPRVAGTSARQYVLLELALLVIICAAVISHQLTPVAMIIALTAFSFAARTRFKGLWLISGVVFIAWFSYGATDYWFGHLENVIGDVGKGGSTLKSGVSERITGDPAHLNAQFLRLAMSGGFALLACVGLFMRRKSAWTPVLAALAFGPFVILGLQSYGGEVVIRCFLFATPILVLLAAETAGFVFRLPRAWTAISVMLILLLASVLQVTARGANQPFERITADQVAAVRTIQNELIPDAAVNRISSVELRSDAGFVANTDTATTVTDEPIVIEVLENDRSSQALASFQVTEEPAHGTVTRDIVTATFTYTPDSGFVGTDAFVYQACDRAAQCSEATVEITVIPTVGYFNDFNPLALMKPRSSYLVGLDYCELPEAEEAAIKAVRGSKEVACADQIRPDWIFASSSQAAYGVLVEGRPADWLDDIVRQLLRTGDYRTVIDDDHVTVLERIKSGGDA